MKADLTGEVCPLLFVFDCFKVFARKLVRPRSRASIEEIENEIRAMTKLCKFELNENVVQVLRTGKLSAAPYYYIDMEKCDFNLETYISNRSVYNVRLMYRSRELFSILKDIMSGVTFLHSHNEVHRDLKPRNS